MAISSDCDLVLLNGNVVTVDRDFSIRQAIGIQGDRIVAVGEDDHVKGLIGPRTQVVNLEGKTILPGINDSHAHTALWAGTRPPLLLDLSFPTVRSANDILDQVQGRVQALEPGEWVRGTGWDTGYLDECLDDPLFRLDRGLLDRVAPDNPVALTDFSLHTLWVNSRALELAGIDRDTPEPPGGVIEKDPLTGEPTGVLVEFAAAGLIMGLIPPWTRAQKRQAISAALDDLSSLGITSLTEPALGPGGDGYQGGLLGSECIGVYQDLLDDAELKMRVNVLYLFGEYGANSLADLKSAVPPLGFHSHFGNGKLKIGGIKIFADGIPSNRTAWMSQEYVGGGHGSLVLPGSTDEERAHELESMIMFAHQRGFQVGVHCIGDLAIEAAIAGFIKAETAEPRHLRHYVMHVDFMSAAQAAAAARHGFGVNVTPALPWVISDMNAEFVGPAQVKREWPYRLIADAGCHLAASSDAPVTHPSWLQGIQSALLRESKATGTVFSADQCLTIEQAIRMYTIGGAWQDGQEHLKGSIEPGKLADLCVLDRDVLTVDPHEISAINNVMTIMDGEVVYRADGY